MSMIRALSGVIFKSAPIPAQGNIRNSAKGNSGRLSRQKETTAQTPAKKGNTPYGQIMTKNGYIMVRPFLLPF